MKDRLRNIALTGIMTGIGAGLGSCGGEDTPLPQPPEGFSRNTHDYNWAVTIDVGHIGAEVVLFSDTKPVLSGGESGAPIVRASNVYCPIGSEGTDQSDYRYDVGCRQEFMGEWEFSNPAKRISVSDNKGIK